MLADMAEVTESPDVWVLRIDLGLEAGVPLAPGLLNGCHRNFSRVEETEPRAKGQERVACVWLSVWAIHPLDGQGPRDSLVKRARGDGQVALLDGGSLGVDPTLQRIRIPEICPCQSWSTWQLS